MPQTLSFPVPSSSLLRFLRAQSQTVFVQSSPFACPARHGTLRSARAPSCRGGALFSTSCVRRASPSGTRLEKDPLVPQSGCAAPRMSGSRKGPDSWTPAGNSYFTTRIPHRWYHEGDPAVTQRRSSWRSRLFGPSKDGEGDGGGGSIAAGTEGGGGTSTGAGGPLKPDDLRPHDGADNNNSMFNTRRTLTAKAALEPRLRCTEVDENGKVILVDGEFKKSELIAKVTMGSSGQAGPMVRG